MDKKPFLIFLFLLSLLCCSCQQRPELLMGDVSTQNATAPDATVPTFQHTPAPNGAKSLGQFQGGVYTNSYAKLRCTLNNDWFFYSADELQALPENLDILFRDPQQHAILDASTQYFAMKADNSTDLTSINLVFTGMNARDQVTMPLLSVKEILKIFQREQSNLFQRYSAMGYQNLSLEPAAVLFLGKQYPALRVYAVSDGIPFYAVQVFDYSLGPYYMTLTVCSYLEDHTDSLLNLFQKLP